MGGLLDGEYSRASGYCPSLSLGHLGGRSGCWEVWSGCFFIWLTGLGHASLCLLLMPFPTLHLVLIIGTSSYHRHKMVMRASLKVHSDGSLPHHTPNQFHPDLSLTSHTWMCPWGWLNGNRPQRQLIQVAREQKPSLWFEMGCVCTALAPRCVIGEAVFAGQRGTLGRTEGRSI